MGGSLIQLPATVGDLRAPGSAADIERYVRWPRAAGRERVKLLKLLWDALGSEFGSRHLQYEMFYAGEPASIQLREFRNFDWAAAEALVDRIALRVTTSTRFSVPRAWFCGSQNRSPGQKAHAKIPSHPG